MPYANVNGQSLYYEDAGGTGPAVIFSHGFLMDHEMFAPQIEALGGNFRCITWDQRGFGKTSGVPKPFTGSRRGIEEGSITIHPSGVPHGPQPGATERSLGATRTEEQAVMWDTFHPLHLTAFDQEIDDPNYAYSWSPNRTGASESK